jgi:regulatory protein
MKLTRIVQQEKQKERYSIFVDGKYAFSLGESALLESKLTAGQELTNDSLTHWKQESADDKVSASAVRYAAIRLRSVWEVEQYLKRKDASPPLVEKVLNKLTKIGLLNDNAFAKSWVANRRLLRPTSQRKLQQELRTKRLGDNAIEVALQDTQEGDELAVLQSIIAKRRNLPRYKAEPMKLMQYLARQGFNYDDIKRVMQREDD